MTPRRGAGLRALVISGMAASSEDRLAASVFRLNRKYWRAPHAGRAPELSMRNSMSRKRGTPESGWYVRPKSGRGHSGARASESPRYLLVYIRSCHFLPPSRIEHLWPSLPVIKTLIIPWCHGAKRDDFQESICIHVYAGAQNWSKSPRRTRKTIKFGMYVGVGW
jgi:hypothetical protein